MCVCVFVCVRARARVRVRVCSPPRAGGEGLGPNATPSSPRAPAGRGENVWGKGCRRGGWMERGRGRGQGGGGGRQTGAASIPHP